MFSFNKVSRMSKSEWVGSLTVRETESGVVFVNSLKTDEKVCFAKECPDVREILW